MNKADYIRQLGPEVLDITPNGEGFNIINARRFPLSFKRQSMDGMTSPYFTIFNGSTYELEFNDDLFSNEDDIRASLMSPQEMRSFLKTIGFISEDLHVNDSKLNYKKDKNPLDKRKI